MRFELGISVVESNCSTTNYTTALTVHVLGSVLPGTFGTWWRWKQQNSYAKLLPFWPPQFREMALASLKKNQEGDQENGDKHKRTTH